MPSSQLIAHSEKMRRWEGEKPRSWEAGKLRRREMGVVEFVELNYST
jgi:hypothetical protein